MYTHTSLTEFPKLISFRTASHRVLICWGKEMWEGRERKRGTGGGGDKG